MNTMTVTNNRLETSSFPLRNLYFGSSEGNPNEVVATVNSIRMNIMQLIAKQLLNVDVEKFAFEPYVPRVEGEVSYFSSGSVFKGLYDLTVEKHEDSTPLCLGISLDTATVNSSRNRSECPVVYTILNLNETAKYELIGYAPIQFPFSDMQLQEMMKKYRSKSRKETIKQFHQRQ